MNDVSLTNNMDFNTETFPTSQTLVIDPKKVFGFQTNMKIVGFNEKTKFVPEIDVSYLNNGVYYLEITNNKIIYRKRFIKLK